MSDVLIKGMGMPTSCHLCEFCIDKNAEIELTKASYICERTGSIVHAYAEGEKSRIDEKTGRIPECPLVEVPTHGRLIQAEEVKELMQSGLCLDTYEDQAYVCSLIDEIPTIIEASTDDTEEREMSDIVIPNAKPPTNCFTCDYEKLTENCPCYIGICSASEYKDIKHPNCPLKEVPPHGDLIDKQAVVKQLSKAWAVECDSDFANKSVWRIVEKEASTIIEASKERDNEWEKNKRIQG